jgi:hypothetical protein
MHLHLSLEVLGPKRTPLQFAPSVSATAHSSHLDLVIQTIIDEQELALSSGEYENEFSNSINTSYSLYGRMESAK